MGSGARPTNNARIPRSSEGLNRPNSVFDELAISFKFWNPFESKKVKTKKYLVRERPRSIERRPAIIHQVPRAPTPPPARPIRGRSPIIVPISPQTARRSQSPRPRRRSRERKPRIKRRKDQPSVVIHQSSSSSEEEKTPSPPLPDREHQRKSRSISPKSKYEAEKKLQRDRERRAYADRVAKEEQEAQRKAARLAEFERLERERKRQERIEYEEMNRIESAERARRRQEQEEFERIQARRRQELEDIRRLEAAERAQRRQEELDRRRRVEHERHRLEEEERLRRARRAHIPRQPRHRPAVHYEGENMEDRGEQFIQEAIRQANQREFERRAPPIAVWPRRTYDDAGLTRRNTVDGSGRWRYGAQRERRDGRLD